MLYPFLKKVSILRNLEFHQNPIGFLKPLSRYTRLYLKYAGTALPAILRKTVGSLSQLIRLLV